MADYFDRNAFIGKAKSLQDKLESRRLAFLRQFYFAIGLSVLALLALFFLKPSPLPTGEAPSSAAWIPFYFSLAVALIAAFFAASTPQRYRGKNTGVGISAQAFSLKDSVFSPLVRFFGNWEYAPDAGLMQYQVKESKILPSYNEFRAEDLLRGTAHDMVMYLAQVALVKQEDGVAKNAFHGLIAVIDISEMSTRLRANFQSHTVLLADANKENFLGKSFASYSTVPMPNAALENRFEAYSTDIEEAMGLLTQPLLEELLSLHVFLQNLQAQHTHADDKAYFAMGQLFSSLGYALLGRADFEKRYSNMQDLDKFNPASRQSKVWQSELQMEFKEDKLTLTLPCSHDPFEPNSMFEPALVPEDLELLFRVMNALEMVARTLDEATPPTQLP